MLSRDSQLPTDNRDLDCALGLRDHPPEPRSRASADIRARPTRQHGTQLARARHRDRVPNEIDRAVHAMQKARRRSTRNYTAPDAPGLQLLNSRKTQLTSREPLRELLTPLGCVLMSLNLGERDDVRDISMAAVVIPGQRGGTRKFPGLCTAIGVG